MKALIRADASSDIGMGHRVRCQTLFHQLKIQGWEVQFVVHERCRQFSNSNDDFIQDEQEFIDRSGSVDLVVLDHYGYSAELIDRLYDNQSNLLVLDDQNNRGNFKFRWLLNPVQMDYSQPGVTFIGPQFALLREQFSLARQRGLLQIQDRDKLLITMGGSDVLNLTFPIINSLFQKGFPAGKMIVLIGKGALEFEQIERFCLQHSIEYHFNVENVSDLMKRSRLAISAAGGTLFELACMGVPSLFLPVADNQINALIEHEEYGWCDVSSHLQETPVATVDTVTDIAMTRWLDNSWLNKASSMAMQLVDGEGAQRVVSQLSRFFVSV